MNNSMEHLMGSIYQRIGKGSEEPATEEVITPEDLRDSMGRMENASCHGKITGSCGETMEVFLRIRGESIEDATFFTDGCLFSMLCGYLAARLATGKNVDDAVQIGGDTLLMSLASVPEGESHCAFLAAEALHAAIHEWMLQR